MNTYMKNYKDKCHTIENLKKKKTINLLYWLCGEILLWKIISFGSTSSIPNISFDPRWDQRFDSRFGSRFGLY